MGIYFAPKAGHEWTQKKSEKEEARFLQYKYIMPATVFTNIWSQGNKNYGWLNVLPRHFANI